MFDHTLFLIEHNEVIASIDFTNIRSELDPKIFANMLKTINLDASTLKNLLLNLNSMKHSFHEMINQNLQLRTHQGMVLNELWFKINVDRVLYHDLEIQNMESDFELKRAETFTTDSKISWSADSLKWIRVFRKELKKNMADLSF